MNDKKTTLKYVLQKRILNRILKERKLNEDIHHCINTGFFGFGNLKNLYKAHKKNYVN